MTTIKYIIKRYRLCRQKQSKCKCLLYFIPDLIFHLDDRLDYVDKMDDLFKKIKDEDAKI